VFCCYTFAMLWYDASYCCLCVQSSMLQYEICGPRSIYSVIDIVLLCLSSHKLFQEFLSSIQVFCCNTFTLLWYDTSYCCLCVQSSMSSPLHQLSLCHLSVLICFQTPVSFFAFVCTVFSAASLHIASLTLLSNVK